MSAVLRESIEDQYAEELAALAAHDQGDRPTNWRLSPQAVRDFIIGLEKPLDYEGKKVTITHKFYGDNALVERAVVTLASNRALLLIGEPGTAKSYLSELLTAAICGNSRNTIQGSIGLTEDMIKYSWNYALLIAKGPIPEALVPSPLYTGMSEGIITRFEEITRAPLEIQDSLISVLSDKILSIPELKEEPFLMAKQGFNIIATANTRDKGVNEMSSALKRRFNFETVRPLNSIKMEAQVIKQQCSRLCEQLPAALIRDDVIELLATTFNELRNGSSVEGGYFDKLNAVMSTAEAVQVYHQTAMDAHYYHNDDLSIKTLAQNVTTSIVKDNPADLKLFKNYIKVVSRTRNGDLFQEFSKQVSSC